MPAQVPRIGPSKRADRLLEPVEPHQAHERRRLAAGDDEPVEAVELLGLANLDRVRAEPAQHRRVLPEVALDGQNADLHASILDSAAFSRGRSIDTAQREELVLTAPGSPEQAAGAQRPASLVPRAAAGRVRRAA